MELIESFHPIGIFRLEFENVHTGIIRVCEYYNTMTLLAKLMIAQRLGGVGNNCDATYVAVGTGVFPATPANSSALVTELFRKVLSSRYYSSAGFTCTGYFGPAEGNGVLTEIALFGEAATGTPGSGTMINHAQISETKTIAETMTMNFTLAL